MLTKKTWDDIDGELKVAWASGESPMSTLPSCVPMSQAEEEELPPAGPSCISCIHTPPTGASS